MATAKPPQKDKLTEAPTNLKEAIDWVLRVTGRDGKKLGDGECICGLAAAVTDLLQSVELEYHGYEKGNDFIYNLFSKVQSIEGTHVVRQLIDGMTTKSQLARLIGWSNGGENSVFGCNECGCMIKPTNGVYLGKGCTRCKDSTDNKQKCSCNNKCKGKEACECAKKGKCCKCYCNDKCKDAKCSCVEKEDAGGAYLRVYKDTYQSSYISFSNNKHFEQYGMTATWNVMHRYTGVNNNGTTASQRRHQCARILLGSVCLIWSGLSYLYWTGKQYSSLNRNSPYWNNHIIDGSGLDDGTLSQWLQALGFPREMLNNSGPQNRLDMVISDNFGNELFDGFKEPTGINALDSYNNTAKCPAGLNYGGFIHAINRDGFSKEANVFKNSNDKIGSLYKLYILSCAYFTGLQKNASTQSSTPNNPKTIREILYWLSALPYSPAYRQLLEHGKGKLKEVLKKPNGSSNSMLSFHQQGRHHAINVEEQNLYAHFQAVTQYCPLVLIGIQGGLKGTDSASSHKEPPIHALYANTECHFTYPTVDIQAYNQVVHYIRGLFYQLYFLRKQCAVKVALGGKWRECRYGHGVESKGVISWMCLGCDPMEHDRNYRAKEMEKGLVGLVNKVKVLEGIKADGIKEVKDVLVTIGKVVVQLGNAQEALERRKGENTVIEGMKTKLQDAKGALDAAKTELEKVKEEPNEKLDEPITKLKALTTNGGMSGILGEVEKTLATVSSRSVPDNKKEYSNAKDKISEAIHGLRYVVEALNTLAEQNEKNVTCHVKEPYNNFLKAIAHLQEICSTPKCHNCKDHATMCGRRGEQKTCEKCHQQYMDGTPSPLQAFLEDRLPGFSCGEVVNDAKEDPTYPPAASHLHHSNAHGQCCPVPMGFRGKFMGTTAVVPSLPPTGSRLYGILYFFSNENMMQSCIYRLVRVTSALSATTPQVLGDVFGFFRGGVGEKDKGWVNSGLGTAIEHTEWIQRGEKYRNSMGQALEKIKGQKNSHSGSSPGITPSPRQNMIKCHCDLSSLSDCTQDQCAKYMSPLTGELYTAVSSTFGDIYLSWVLYLSDALEGGLKSLASAFLQIECRGCTGCDPNKCKKGSHGEKGSGQCQCQSIVSCTGVLPVLYRHGFSYGNPFNLEGYQEKGKDKGDYSIEKDEKTVKHCHEFLQSLQDVIKKKKEASQGQDIKHPLHELLSAVGKLQYDIRLPWIFVLTVAWLVAVLYLAFGAIWPLDWTHMRSHWLRGGAHQWEAMWYKVMTGRKGRVVLEGMEYFGGKGVEEVKNDNSTLRTVLLSGAKGWGSG